MHPQLTEPQSSNPEPKADRMCDPEGSGHARRGRRRTKTARTPPAEAMTTRDQRVCTVEEFVPITLYRCQVRPEMLARTVPRMRDIITWHKLTQKISKTRREHPCDQCIHIYMYGTYRARNGCSAQLLRNSNRPCQDSMRLSV